MRSVRLCGTIAGVRDSARWRGSGAGVRRLVRRLAGVALAVAIPVTMTVAGAPGPAAAAYNSDGFDFWVDSSMGPIKNRVFRAADGNTDRVVYALDGLRARNDLSGWEIDTDVSRVLPQWNINVVMPIGGQSSFYSDWAAPSNTNGQTVRYAWETFLTRDLRDALHERLGFKPVGNGVFGLSMGGSAALALAAYHPDQFRYAASYSGYLNPSGPGMREALRAAMLDLKRFQHRRHVGPAVGPALAAERPDLFRAAVAAERHPAVDFLGQRPARPPRRRSRPDRRLPPDQCGGARGGGAGQHPRVPGPPRHGQRGFRLHPVGVHFWHYWTDEVYKMLPDLSANLG